MIIASCKCLVLLLLLTVSLPLFAQKDLLTAPRDVTELPEVVRDALFLPPQAIPEKGEATCLKCKGVGQIQSALQSKDERFSKSKKRKHQTQLDVTPDFLIPCPVCKGQKRIVRTLTLQERIDRFLSVRNAYDLEHATAHHVPFGSGYIHKSLLEQLSPESYATLAAQFPAACQKCLGFSLIPCNRCKSTGKREKVNANAPDSIEEEQCTSCNGSGGRLCQTCNGSGLLKPCRRCKGLGITQEKATKKHPSQTIRCRSCDGMGRR
ncbi:MAG: hypothetical protein IJV69_04540 [Kiritimatiellae bacterium]|nr:hypothetical protein [Kiritimatiellia bacterium]